MSDAANIVIESSTNSIEVVEERTQIELIDSTQSIVVIDESEISEIIVDVVDNTIQIIDETQSVVIIDVVNTINLIEEIGGGGSSPGECANCPILTPTIGSWTDGLNQWTSAVKIKDALYELNLIEKYLAPADAGGLDGSTLDMSGTTLMQGRLSQDNINYQPGVPAGTPVPYIITDATFSLFSAPATFNKADKGTLKLYVNDVVVDSFDLATPFSEALRAGNQTYPPSSSPLSLITVTAVGWYNNFPLWQKGACTLNISSSLLRQGWNHIKLSHENITTPQDSAEYNVFYDQGTITSSIAIPTVSEKTPAYRYLSGVKFYGRGATFNLGAIASNVFDNTYHITSPVIFDSTSGTMGSGTIDYNDPSVSGVSSPPRISEETMTITDKTLTVPSSNLRSINARASVQSRKPWCNSAWVQSASVNRMIDAYAITSDALHEYFDDEDRRLPSGSYDTIPGSVSGVWDSSVFLTNGEAQVFNGQLISPHENFSTYLPSSGQPDYSAFTGPQNYFRAFVKISDPHSSGKLRLTPLNASDVSPVGTGNINIEIKLPSQTGWLDLGKPFDSGTFTGIDGDGCRVTVSGSDFSWTCGTFSTAYSGWMIVVRITLRNGIPMNEISEVVW